MAVSPAKKVFLTVDHAAKLLRVTREEVLDLVKKGALSTQYMQNTGGLGIDRDAVIRHLKKTGNWEAIRASITPRLVIVDYETRVFEIVKPELKRAGVDIRLCGTGKEVREAIKSFVPDVISVRLSRDHVARDPQLQIVIEAIVELRRVAKVVVYHDLTPSELAAKSEVPTQMRLVPAEFLINVTSGCRPLLEAVKIELGIRD